LLDVDAVTVDGLHRALTLGANHNSRLSEDIHAARPGSRYLPSVR
jgi:hypothetical protein